MFGIVYIKSWNQICNLWDERFKWLIRKKESFDIFCQKRQFDLIKNAQVILFSSVSHDIVTVSACTTSRRFFFSSDLFDGVAQPDVFSCLKCFLTCNLPRIHCKLLTPCFSYIDKSKCVSSKRPQSYLFQGASPDFTQPALLSPGVKTYMWLICDEKKETHLLRFCIIVYISGNSFWKCMQPSWWRPRSGLQ